MTNPMKLSWNMDESGTIQIFRMDNDDVKVSVCDVWRVKREGQENEDAKRDQVNLANFLCASPEMNTALEEAKWLLPPENGRINHIVNRALAKAAGKTQAS